MLASSSTNSTRGFTPTNLAAQARAFPRFNPGLAGAWPPGGDSQPMRSSRTTIAVVAAIAALGALPAVAFASGGDPTPTAPAPAAETDPPVQVKTKVIHRTVHVRPARASSDDD